MDRLNSELFGIFVPNSPDRHVFKELKEVKKFLDSPLGKKEGTRFKKCADDNELNLFFEERFRNDSCTVKTDVSYSSSMSVTAAGDGGSEATTPLINGATLNNSTPSTSKTIDGKPVTPYRKVPTARFTEFRHVIEKKNESKFEELLLENPRFLLNTNTDLPAILQEGYRFNTLHIACRTNNCRVVERALELSTNLKWLTHVYGTDVCVEERSKYLTEALLNTPDLIENNTPLHYACKFGYSNIVRLLLSYPSCKRYSVNKYGERPLDMLCRSFKGTEEDKQSTRELILSMFRPSLSPHRKVGIKPHDSLPVSSWTAAQSQQALASASIAANETSTSTNLTPKINEQVTPEECAHLSKELIEEVKSEMPLNTNSVVDPVFSFQSYFNALIERFKFF